MSTRHEGQLLTGVVGNPGNIWKTKIERTELAGLFKYESLNNSVTDHKLQWRCQCLPHNLINILSTFQRNIDWFFLESLSHCYMIYPHQRYAEAPLVKRAKVTGLLFRASRWAAVRTLTVTGLQVRLPSSLPLVGKTTVWYVVILLKGLYSLLTTWTQPWFQGWNTLLWLLCECACRVFWRQRLQLALHKVSASAPLKTTVTSLT